MQSDFQFKVRRLNDTMHPSKITGGENSNVSSKNFPIVNRRMRRALKKGRYNIAIIGSTERNDK